MKILVIQQKMIGDVLTSSILFEALKEKYSNAELHYVINKHTYPVVENNPFIDRFLYITPEIEKSKLAFYKFLKSIRKEEYDAVIDVYSKNSSNLMTLFSGAKTKISKHKWYTSFLYNHVFKDEKTKKTNAGLAVENRLQLLEPFGIDSSKIYKPKIYLSPSEIEDSKIFLETSGIDLKQPLFMIGVLGSSLDKTYPFEYMAKVIDLLVAETNGQILFNYIPKQEDDARSIYNLCKPETQEHIYFDVFGKSLREFLAITHHCTALIGNEGGATNMAKALNIPTFTIFSPWIDKDAWNMFDNDITNISVHLNDFNPEIYNNVEKHKELKQNTKSLYQKFSLDKFEDIFKAFLKQF